MFVPFRTGAAKTRCRISRRTSKGRPSVAWKRRLLRPFPPLVVLLFALLVFSCARRTPTTALPPSPAASGGTEILWDTWGVPHIYGADTEGLFYAFGWAQMQSHGDLILRLYGQARGRAAEYWGQSYLESDRWVRTVGVPTRARDWYQAQSPVFRRYLDAFAEGMNAYGRQHADQIADDVKTVLPISATDVLAHVQHVIDFSFVTSPEAIAVGTGQWQPNGGSNGWAIAPAHSQNKHAMLLANPHLFWSDFSLFFEAQLTGPGLDAYGATLVGFPVLGIAFNDYLGWTHTVNTQDGQDLYELTLAPGGYRWDGKVRAFETEEQVLKVKQNDGALRDEKLVIRRSIHGPVVAEFGGKTIALRSVGLDRAGMCEEWWDMARARNLTEFETALRRLQIPTFTVLYADRDGHILYLFGGQTPVRPKGGYDWSGVVSGDTSATLWTKTHPYEELPRVVDPRSGWLQNANDPPWTATFPRVLNADDFVPYMAPRFMDFRAQRSVRMLSEHSSMSFDEVVQDKLSTRMELADRILDDLIPAARRGGGTAVRAANILAAWDRCADANSRGAVLFQAFVLEVKRRSGSGSPFAVRWDETDPLTTPKGLSDPVVAVAALEAAAKQVEALYGAMDVAWGDVYRLRRGNVDLPANGGPGSLGIFRVVEFMPAENNRFKAIAGDSFVAVVEFSDPVRAKVLTGYGNSSQPNSPHLSDQLQLFALKQLRPAWRARKEILAHLAQREAFGVGNRN
jgi:acyl-homoserine-lactone acylase